MRVDLLDIIARSTEVTNAIVVTHNIDFAFLQTVVLAAFRTCGHPTITVFADAQCAAESYALQAPLLDGLGTRYRVVPISMTTGGRFHPKAVLLSGPKAGTLLVGSGNLTFGGWRENAEIWTRFDAVTDGPQAFVELESYVRQVLERVPLGQAVAAEVDEAFDRKTRPWLAVPVPAGPRRLLGRAAAGEALVDEMAKEVGGPLDELIVGVPYFDEDGVALGAVIERLHAPRATVLCQPWRSTLTRRAFAANAARAALRHVTFEHVDENGASRRAFLHAKFYAAVHGESVTVFAGSANCSIAALMTAGAAGNAELLAVRRMSRAEFGAAFLAELVEKTEPIELPEAWTDHDEAARPPFVVLAARLDAGVLEAAFSPSRAELRSCTVDGMVLPRPSLVGPGRLRVACSGEPHSVQIHGVLDGAAVQSPPSWIDHEQHLRATAHGRNLAAVLRGQVQTGQWNASAWADVMTVVCRHVAYMPERATASQGSSGKATGGAGPFSYADVFASTYSPAKIEESHLLGVPLAGNKEQVLQALLLRWFGVPAEREEVGEPSSPSVDETDGGDAPLELRLVAELTVAPQVLSDADRRRIEKLVAQAEHALTDPVYLAGRTAEQLAADLAIVAALLRTGLNERWISSDDFFRVSHRVWTALFLDGSPSAGFGWIEYRMYDAADPDVFAAALRSPPLAAALLGWAFAVPPKGASAEATRFKLAVALAVARLPWLWDAGDPAAVTRELELLARTTSPGGLGTTATAIHEARELTLRRGHALMHFENAVSTVAPADLRARIRRSEVAAGDLLWQGKAGYCVAMDHAARTDKVKVPVLKLQGRVEPTHFVASFTVPVVDLLDAAVIPLSPSFGLAPRQVLSTFLTELARDAPPFVKPEVIHA